MYLLGFDIGSSSVKAALIDPASTSVIDAVQSPSVEMGIAAPQVGWAEQDPQTWWHHVCETARQLASRHPEKLNTVGGIGLSYQMHGLVLVDQNQAVLRPSIIWCDSRAVAIGDRAFEAIGQEICLDHFLNSPGNFTASKLRWVRENEPEIYEKIKYCMLPGDYIAMRMTGEVNTTISGLSEGIFWDFKENREASLLLDHYDIDPKLLPPLVDTFSVQGKLSQEAAEALGLPPGTPVTYRAGDQPNNALSLNVLHPGEIAATGGTSGVVYGIVDEPVSDAQSRVNGFVHVNHQADKARYGVLLCVNGAGIQYSWMRQITGGEELSYLAMGEEAAPVPVGSDGLMILPFGNGAERILQNKNIGSHIGNLNFNRHHRGHLYRAALEGIAFSFVYGLEILEEMGLSIQTMRVDSQNLFRSSIFSQTIANLVQSQINVLDTNGAIGAARAAGVAVGLYANVEEAVREQKVLLSYRPENKATAYQEAYGRWKNYLADKLKEP
jgi:xylulokinase